MQKREHHRDFLQRFSTTQFITHQEKKNEKSDINLGLALSLGGIYSCENSNEKPSLARSSSIIGMMSLHKDDDGHADDPSLPKSFLSLSRSCSLPTEAEQKQRKATLMALARRKTESTDSFMRFHEQEKYLVKEPMPSSPSKMAAWAAASAAKSPALCRALVQIKRQASLHSSRNIEGQEGFAVPNSATHPHSFATKEAAEPTKLLLEANANGKLLKVAEIKLQHQSKRPKLVNNGFEDRGMDVMKQMPSVTTTGDGPNGRRVEGFLYKYRKGQVSIVCVCHGSFLSPAEFVRHAGGTDVANPMKHITVCSTFSF